MCVHLSPSTVLYGGSYFSYGIVSLNNILITIIRLKPTISMTTCNTTHIYIIIQLQLEVQCVFCKNQVVIQLFCTNELSIPIISILMYTSTHSHAYARACMPCTRTDTMTNSNVLDNLASNFH